MPRKYFRKHLLRHLPTHASIHEHRWFGRFGRFLAHPNLWHLNRHSVAGGLALGLFAGLVPGPLQMLCAVLLAIPLHVNLPVALLTTLYTNPLTIVPLYVLAYEYGSLLLGEAGAVQTVKVFEMDWLHLVDSTRALFDWMVSLGKPLAVGLPALALTLAALGYFAVRIAWRVAGHPRLACPPAQAQRAQTPMITLQSTSLLVRFYHAFRNPFLMFVAVMLVGSTGFWIVADYKATPLDCIYMTFITVATIGFGETIDLSHSPGGRVFLMLIATVGIANVTYATSKLTAFILESDLNEALRRRRMQDRIDKLQQHYIICGIGRVGTNVAHELHLTERKFVALEDAPPAIGTFREKYPDTLVLHGDSTDDEMLRSDNRPRVEEVRVPEGFARRPLAELVTASRDYILLAARLQDQWQFNPGPEFMIGPGTTLVVMVNPEGRGMLEKLFATYRSFPKT